MKMSKLFYVLQAAFGSGACVSRVPGVLSTSVGYCGGRIDNQPMKRCVLDGRGTLRLAR